jgi:hypothetical protein
MDIIGQNAAGGNMKLISLVKCCRWKYEIDIIGQNAA